jgi:UDPglucose 6-dehydrogenase
LSLEAGEEGHVIHSSPRKISIIGTGYVGLVTALAFANHGHRVTCVDLIRERIEQIGRGEAPFYEPGVAQALSAHVGSGLLSATTDTHQAVSSSEVTFLCVGTPSAPDGSYDLAYIEAAATTVGEALRDLEGHHVVVTKSTLTPTANRDVILPSLSRASGLEAPSDFSLACNPEFLREGSALQDALGPDRIVLGVMKGDIIAQDMLEELYRPFGRPIVVTSLEGAELIKLASNSLLAIKVAFANEVANVAQAVGADGVEVLEGVGLDHRLGPYFLRAGAGFGGSCFPKDLRALVTFAKSIDLPALMPTAALEQNEIQPRRVISLVRRALGHDLGGKRLALLGLAFKPETDDVRETRALPILQALLEAGAEVRCHDPRAEEGFASIARDAGIGDIAFAPSLEDTLRDVDAAIIQTEWQEYKSLDPAELIRLMRGPPIVIDARRALDADRMLAGGVEYYAVGFSPSN